jgi:hypothetical protein
MDSLPEELVTKLKLPKAIEDEIATTRNLIPDDPWIAAAASKKAELVRFVETQLRVGILSSEAPITNARKGSYGTRPVPTVGICERIAYRALTDFILSDVNIQRRSNDQYKEMIVGPILHAFSSSTSRPLRLSDATVGHVVEADISAFYQYIDHEILYRELCMQTGKIDAAEYLLKLITEIQGRSFGLPQLLDPSDDLSEVYIRIVERDLIRQGLTVWRYNDDFRIACQGYEDALDAIEVLAESARKVGLTLADHKTKTPIFLTYLMHNSNTTIEDGEVVIDSEIFTSATGYLVDDSDEAVRLALKTISKLDSASPDWVSLNKLDAGDVQDIRRAVNSLGANLHEGAIPYIADLFKFFPSLTPRLMAYLRAIYGLNEVAVSEVWDKISTSAGISEWQAVWLVNTARELGLLKDAPDRQRWVRQQHHRGAGKLLAAESALALARASSANFSILDQALRIEPEALSAWYVLAMKELARTGSASIDSKIAAVKNGSALHKLILES